jgi:serine/threonine protein kinase
MFHRQFTRCPFDGATLERGPRDRLIGQILSERYVLQELVGVGSVGRVYRARHVRLERSYAIKVLFGELAADGKSRTRFLREATAASRLHHPHLLSVLDVAETQRGLCYMVMDFVAGEDLHKVISRSGPMSEERVIDLLRQITRGLGHAHDHGVIHRDLKCDNVMVTSSEDGELARVVDFGIALTAEALEPGQRLTTAGTVLGTPAYMSPEQLCGQEIDHRADLFSLGVMLYRMLAGRLPFDGGPLDMATSNLNDDVPAIAERVPGLVVDQRLEATALRLMAKDPHDRFASARAVLEHLDAGPAPLRRPAKGSEPPAAEVSEPARPVPAIISVTSVPVIALDEEAASRRTSLVRTAAGLAVFLAVGAALLQLAGSSPEGRRSPPARVAAATPVTRPSPLPDLPAPAPAPPVIEEEAPPVAPAPRPKLQKRAAPAAVPVDDFRRTYLRVGKRLAGLAETRGEAAVDPLRQRYFDIPFADSLRSDAIRRDAMLVLRQLGADLDRGE